MNWRPIAELPEEWKDGRPVLLGDETFSAVCRYSVGIYRWSLAHYFACQEYDWEPTHYAPDFVPLNPASPAAPADGPAMDSA